MDVFAIITTKSAHNSVIFVWAILLKCSDWKDKEISIPDPGNNDLVFVCLFLFVIKAEKKFISTLKEEKK